MTTIRIRLNALALLVWLGAATQIHAQATAFTYQGRLNDGGAPANGTYDFRFRLAADALGNNLVASPLLSNAVPVAGGLLTVALDFGVGVFTGSNYWLQVDVKTNSAGSYTTLTPLQALTPTPYAIFANTASNLSGTLAAAQLSGALPSTQLAGTYSGPVTFNNPANNFAGNGTGLANVNAATLGGLSASNFWKTGGNAGTAPGAQFLGTTDNQPLEFKVNNTRGLRIEPTASDAEHSGIVNVVGGSPVNFVAPGVFGQTIAGGGALNFFGFTASNSVLADFSTIGGGLGNTIQPDALYSTVGGGLQNTIQTNANSSVIAAGNNNSILAGAYSSTIAGGQNNTIATNSPESVIGGGAFNTIQFSAANSTIAGGFGNTIRSNAQVSAIGGGDLNVIQSSGDHSIIAGGIQNTIGSQFSTIAGGNRNTIGTGASDTIGGGILNMIQGSFNSTIGGGNQNTIGFVASGATIGGGILNLIQDNSIYAFIGGGSLNTNAGQYAAIGGGLRNNIQIGADYSLIGAGYNNTIASSSSESVIGGGDRNTIQSGAQNSVIGGGDQNTIEISAFQSVLGGGTLSTIQSNASYAVIGGGIQNLIQSNAVAASIGGGFANTNSGYYGTVPGGDRNVAGTNSFAAGHRAKATHTGSFVWADSIDADFPTTGTNQLLIRASGGVGIGKTNPVGALDVNGAVTAASFNGNGVGLSSLNASQLSSGTLADGRLSTNVALLSGSQTFSGAKAFTNTANSFAGSGSGLVALNAANLSSGTLADARLSTNVPLLSADQTFTGSNTFSGNLAASGLFKLSRVTLAPTAASTITPTASFVLLSPASAVTLSATTAIADPAGGTSAAGTILILQGGNDANAVTINDAANTALGAASRTLGVNDMLTLIYNGALWVELSFVNN